MGAVTSQIGQTNLKVMNPPSFKHNAELEKQKTQPKILVSINKDNTVRISEGISIATQTPRDEYGLNDVKEKVQAKNEENQKEIEALMAETTKARSVQTDITGNEYTEHRKGRENVDQVMISPVRFNGEEQESVGINENLQESNQNTSSSIEAGNSETETSLTDYWNIGIQTDDDVDHREEKKINLNDDQTIIPPIRFKEEEQENIARKENLQIVNQNNFSSVEARENGNRFDGVDNSSDTGLQTDEDADHEQLGPRIAWGYKSVNSDKSLNNYSKEANSKEEKEVDTKTTCNTPARLFEHLSLERYGKYKVRLSSDEEKCIISSASFLETGDVVIIDRSNQKMKFVDKDFQFISSFDLPAKPWAVCSRGIDIYVTMGNTKIQHLTVEDMIMEPVEVFDIKGRCLGICVFGEYLAVGLQVGEVCLLDLKGTKHGAIKLPTFNGKPCNPWHLTVTAENNILVTDSDAGVLYCVNDKSELVFSFKGLGSPRGTAIDSEGNIMLAGRDKETGAVVTILHKDGELHHMLHIEEQWEMKSRVLMTWEQLEFVPYCVCFRKDRVVILGGLQDSLKIMKL